MKPVRVLLGAGSAASALALAACGGGTAVGSAMLQTTAQVAVAASNPVAVSPLPGTMDASASTQISFLGPSGTTVTAVRVRGSASGLHSGVLRAYSTGTGESFLPAHPFVAGERVSVSARVSVAGASHTARTSFQIAHQAPIRMTEFPNNPGDPKAVQHYKSAPALTPSKVTIKTPSKPGASPGYLLLAPYQGKGTPGPMITDQSGNLVWFQPLPAGQVATNLDVQQYEGRPALVWWRGHVPELGFGLGEDLVMDSSYRTLARIRAGNGYHADLHVVRITPEGTAWIDAYNPVQMNLSSAGGAAKGVLSDSLVQEVDIRTGLVMWEWHALGHIPTSDSFNPAPHSSYPWDYVHINAIDPGGQGDVLLSFRNTWSLDDVDIDTGGFRWRIGGVHSSFRLGPGVKFYWQHDAAFQPDGLISLFDNGSDPPKERQSRGLLLRPDLAAHTVTLVKQFTNPSRTLLAESQGSMTSLSGGNWLLGYGRLPDFTEFDASGRVLLDGALGHNVQNFSTSLAPWSGHPLTAPSVVASPSGSGLSVAVSWNGATDVASWRVLAGSDPAHLAPAASAAKSGFETTIAVPAPGPWVAVQALDAGGTVLATSPASKA